MNTLEIIVITYNRAELLGATLDRLAASPFSHCRITVLNNASTDHTQQVVQYKRPLFSDLRLVNNVVNIGGDANILRAVELATADYLWILADDDTYDFTDVSDVIETIEQGTVDLVHVGAHTDVEWTMGGQTATPRELVKKGYPYFRFSSFLPCNLFRREAFLPHIIAGYKNIISLYPHMPFLLNYYTENKPMYISRRRIVSAGIGQQNYNHTEQYLGWLRTSRLLPKRRDVMTCFRQQFGVDTNVDMALYYTLLCAREKAYRPHWSYVFGSLTFVEKILFFLLTIARGLTRTGKFLARCGKGIVRGTRLTWKFTKRVARYIASQANATVRGIKNIVNNLKDDE